MSFYDTSVFIMKKKPASSGYGADENEQWETVTSTRADIQPYSGGLAQEQYGLHADCQKRMYCDVCPDITEGAGITLDENACEPEYIVTYAESWNTYTMAFLKRR